MASVRHEHEARDDSRASQFGTGRFSEAAGRRPATLRRPSRDGRKPPLRFQVAAHPVAGGANDVSADLEVAPGQPDKVLLSGQSLEQSLRRIP